MFNNVGGEYLELGVASLSVKTTNTANIWFPLLSLFPRWSHALNTTEIKKLSQFVF